MTSKALENQIVAPKPPKQKKVSNSRPARWSRACGEGQDALAQAVEARDELEKLRETAREEIEKEREDAEDAFHCTPACPTQKPPSERGTTADVCTCVKPKPPDIDDEIEKRDEVITALATLNEHIETINNAIEALNDLKGEYEEWLGNLPDSLQSSPVADKLNEVTNLDLNGDLDIDNFEEAEDTFGEAENADLPLGFGKD